jgi:hypothetical protein
VGNKIYKIPIIFEYIEHLKNRGVTYWAERNGLLVDYIIDQGNGKPFETILKTIFYSLIISRLAACIWINLFLYGRYEVGLCSILLLVLLY